MKKYVRVTNVVTYVYVRVTDVVKLVYVHVTNVIAYDTQLAGDITDAQTEPDMITPFGTARTTEMV